MFKFLIFSLLATAFANVVHNGACPDLKPVENFNLTAYQGVWYEISKFAIVSERDGKCGSAEYKLEGDVVKVKNVHVVNGVQTFIEGTAKLAPDANGSAKVIVTFKFGDVARDSNLMVLKTDYEHYSIAYNCVYDEKNKSHEDHMWILSRSKTLEGDAKAAVDAFLAEQKDIDSSKLIQTDFSEEACKFNGTSLITEDVSSKKI